MPEYHQTARILTSLIDEAESGRSIDSPGFQNMIAHARQKPPLLEKLEIDSLTPLEALTKLYKLQKKARGTEGMRLG